jgi:hypothetical protein
MVWYLLKKGMANVTFSFLLGMKCDRVYHAEFYYAVSVFFAANKLLLFNPPKLVYFNK